MRAGEFRERLKPCARLLLAVQESGISLVEAGDIESTMAELLWKTIKPLSIDLCLKSREPGRRLLEFVNAGSDGSFFPIAGPGRDMEIHHTPGHSPDSICLRVGRLLFSGDILFALNPFVAGIKGWSRDDLIQSLKFLLRVIDDYCVEWLLPGHGDPMPVAIARKLLCSVLDQAQKMDAVAGVTRQRIVEARDYAIELLSEPGNVPTIGLVNGIRFQDALVCLLQNLSALKADRIAIRSSVKAGGIVVMIEASGVSAQIDMPATRLAAHIRHFAMAGISLESGTHDKALRMVLMMKADR